MLVLTRKNDESIQIGDNITVKIIQADRNKVRIGIEAPQEVRVLRSELRGPRQSPWPGRQAVDRKLALV